MGCPCPSPSPSPPCNAMTGTDSYIDGNIAMFFGVVRSSGICQSGWFDNIIPGLLNSPTTADECANTQGIWQSGNYTKVFMATGEDFRLEYTAIDLVRAGILPIWTLQNSDTQQCSPKIRPYNKLPNPPFKTTEKPLWGDRYPDKLYPFDTFILTEQELLSANSFESWISWCALRASCYYGWKENACAHITNMPFGIRVMQALGLPFEQLILRATREINSIEKYSDPTFFGRLTHAITKVIQDALFPGYSRAYEDSISIWYTKQNDRLLIAFEWLKSIYDNYYGKQFLVKIGNNTPAYDKNKLDNGHVAFKGVCVKDIYGNYPEPSSYPLVVQGDGSTQGFFLSDQISQDGGYPLRNTDNILGLPLGSVLDEVRTEDGRIQTFVKFGYFRKLVNHATFDKRWEYFPISKFGKSFTVDIGKMNPSNYFIVQEQVDLDNINTRPPMTPLPLVTVETLFIKATISDEIYFLDKNKGQWARITLNEMVPLVLIENRGAIQAGAEFLTTIDDLYPSNLEFITAQSGVIASNAPSSMPFGAKLSSSQVNVHKMNTISVMPFGAAIPMRSNIFNYGPYYYDGSNGYAGGVDVVIDKTLCPWNFDNTVFNQNVKAETVYTYMDCMGKELARDGIIGLQYLEKGSVTIEALPNYGIGYSVNTNITGIAGPTLVTDIAVDFGANGMNTTYNFQTYTPRVGRPARYLVDSWAESIKLIQQTNLLLREERNRANNLSLEVSKKILSKPGTDTKNKLLSTTPISKYQHTPTKLLISGYYMRQDFDPENNSINPSTSIDPWPSASQCIFGSPCPSRSPCPQCSSSPKPSCCYGTSSPCPSLSPPPSASPSASPSSSPNCSNCPSPYPSASGNYHRVFSFAEHHEGYSDQHAQNTYKQLAIMSLDGLFLPVSLLGDGEGAVEIINDPFKDGNDFYKNINTSNAPSVGPSDPRSTFGRVCGISNHINDINLNRIPRYARFISLDDRTYSDIFPSQGILAPTKSRDSLPPFKYNDILTYSLAINQTFLNPMLSRRMITDKYLDKNGNEVDQSPSYGWIPRSSGTDNGFVISNIAFGNHFENYEYSNLPQEEYIKQNQSNFRFSALRGPLVIQGWGYDTEGKPIPNYADSPIDTERGIFKRSHLTDNFMKNWIQNPRTWPVGPIDLRFDRERGVWTCAPPNKIVVARLLNDLGVGGEASARLLSNDEYYGPYNLSDVEGRNIKLDMKNTKITVCDFLGKQYNKDNIVYAYYLHSDRYIVLDGTKTNKSVLIDDNGCPINDCDNCWYDLDILKTIPSYKEGTKQALIHTASSGNGVCYTYPCLAWEDIISCEISPSPNPSPSPSASPLPSPSSSSCPSTNLITLPCTEEGAYPPDSDFFIDDLPGNNVAQTISILVGKGYGNVTSTWVAPTPPNTVGGWAINVTCCEYDFEDSENFNLCGSMYTIYTCKRSS